MRCYVLVMRTGFLTLTLLGLLFLHSLSCHVLKPTMVIWLAGLVAASLAVLAGAVGLTLPEQDLIEEGVR